MKYKKKLSARTLRIMTLVFGLLFLAVGAGMTYFSYQFIQAAITTTGVVTHVEHSRHAGRGSTGTFYTPTITFLDEQGASQTAQILPGQHSYNFPLGTEKRIRYNPQNPSHIKLDSWFGLWGIGAIFFAVGFGMVFSDMFFASQRKKKHGGLVGASGGSAEDTGQITAFLRQMGQHAEADEITNEMKSAENEARQRNKRTVFRSK